jgi:hypothetical protein
MAEVRFFILFMIITFMSNPGPWATVHILVLHRSTSLTMTHFSTFFYLYRPFLLGEEGQAVNIRFRGGAQWVGERWWYSLAHVCQRWRNIILGSASFLGLCGRILSLVIAQLSQDDRRLITLHSSSVMIVFRVLLGLNKAMDTTR